MKKRRSSQVLSCILALILVLSMVPVVNVSAVATNITEVAGTTTSGFEYEISGGEVTITDYTGSATKCTIPSQIEGYPVTSIGEWAFSYCDSLTSITIPEGVTSIGESAFLGCTSLTSITIPEGVTSIGNYAFSSCKSLTSITIPEGVTSIGNGVLSSCESLASITIPSSVTSIGEYAFSSCTSLTSITIPSSVTSIGNYAFSSCTSLTSITIPSSVTSIGEYAFYYCTSLTSITIPEGVTSIENCAFLGCTSLISITVDEDNTVYDSRNDCNAIIKTDTNTIIAGCADTVIPMGVTSIGYRAFSSCASLTSITIPSSVTSIGNYAFSSCKSLTSITIPSSVTSIGNDVFYNCTSLTSITIPEGVTSIGNGAFSGCTRLKSITIPSSVTSIGEYAFSSCTGLTSITVDEDNTVYDSRNDCNAIIETDTNTIIAGCADTVIPSSVTSIGEWAFLDCTSLTSITIPSSVTSIGEAAFLGCTSLKSITIPSSVTSIGGWAFSDCTSLTSITIPSSVTSIGYRAFNDCASLTSITIPEGVTSIGEGAFSSCESLTSITIPSSVTSIGELAFSSCTGLTSITIPEGVTSIGYSAFYYCTSLTSITIPSSVTSIGDYAFYYCTSLTSITIPSSVTSIGDYAFYNCRMLNDVYYSGTQAQWNAIKIGSSGRDYLLDAEIHYNYVDSTKPTVSISTTNLSASSQTATLSMSDNVGVVSYYWGTSSNPSSSSFTTISSTTSTSIQKTVSFSGTYYLIAKDAAGNVSSTASITYYKTTLNANGGSVSPTTVITKSGNSVTLPKSIRSGYSFVGWGTSSTSTSGVTSVTVTSSRTYYAVWTPADTTKPTVSISSTNLVSASQTATLSLSDNVGVVSYYWGTSSNPSSSSFTAITSTKSTSIQKSVSSSGTYYLIAKDAAGNVSIVATITYYKTTLNANGGSVSPSSVLTKSGNSVTLPTPTKSGYSFAGWGTSSSSTSGVTSVTVTSNKTYYAVWEDFTIPSVSIGYTDGAASNMKVTLNLSDNVGVVSYYWGTTSSPSSSSFTTITGTKSTSIEKTITSKGTYYFIAKDASGNTSTTLSITCYQITLDANGGSVSPTTVLAASGQSITLPTPTRTNYSFVGWGTSSSSTSGVTSATVTGNKTYYAVWSYVDSTKPTVSISSTNLVSASQTATLSLSDNVGVVSYYWGTSSSPSSSSYTAITSTKSTSIQKTVSSSGTYYLFAKDAAGNVSTAASVTYYKTTLNANGGSVSPVSVLTKNGETVILPTPTRTNYGFAGWGTTSTATSGINALTVYENKTYYAIWSDKDTKNPTVSVRSTNNVASSQTATLTMSDNIGVVSYYWGKSASPSSGLFTSVASATSKSVDVRVYESGTYYLIAKDAEGNSSITAATFYTTTLNANGGTVSPSSILTKSGNTVTLPTPVKNSYKYLGWNVSSTATSGNLSVSVTSNRTYYAVWEYIHTCSFTGEEEIVIDATCTENGSKLVHCTEPSCSKVQTVVIEAYGHSEGVWEVVKPVTCLENGLKERRCPDCDHLFESETIYSTGHSMGEWYVYRKPGFYTQGEERKDCVNCDYFDYKFIPETSIGHQCDFTGEEEIVFAATCTESGNKKIYCFEPECGEYIWETIESFGHSLGDWQVYKEAKFHEKGEERKTCERCAYFESRPIPETSIGHKCKFTGKEEFIVKATCLDDGSKKVFCFEPECGKFKTTTVKRTGHNISDWTVYTEVQFYIDGEERKTCANCDFYESRVIPKLSESHTCSFTGRVNVVFEPTCTETGLKKTYCIEPECGKYLTETPEALGHTESEFAVVKDATCTEDGTKQQKCTVCDEILNTEVITAYGHEYNDWTVIKEATDTESGEKTRECLICHYVESEIIDPLIPPPTTPDEEETDLGLLGDVNGDGKVNIKDATIIQKAAAKIVELTDEEKLRADVNVDSKNNVKDATAIQKFVAKIETGYPIGEKIK